MHSDIDHTVLPANYTMPAFTPQLQSITAFWLVLILPSHGGLNQQTMNQEDRCISGGTDKTKQA